MCIACRLCAVSVIEAGATAYPFISCLIRHRSRNFIADFQPFIGALNFPLYGNRILIIIRRPPRQHQLELERRNYTHPQ